jgi:hypothetical protein
MVVNLQSRKGCDKTHPELYEHDLSVIRAMCTESGAVIAAPGAQYDRVWIRDCCEVAYCLLLCDEADLGKKILRGIFNILHRHNANVKKIDHIIEHGKPPVDEGWKLFHPLYDRHGNEMHHENGWGWCQNDAIGLFLFCVAKAEEIDQDFLTVKDLRFIQQVVLYLMVVRYWEADNSVWEECLCENSTSISSCVAGLKAVNQHLGIFVPEIMVNIGKRKQQELAKKHSHIHPIDAAHLQIFFPLGLSDDVSIIDEIHRNLSGEYGIARYPKDAYEAGDDGSEAQWPLILFWEGLAWLSLGDREAALECLVKGDSLRLEDGNIPEAYRYHVDGETSGYLPCPHTPLTWAHAFALALRYQLGLAS